MSTEEQINRQVIRGLTFPCSEYFTKEKIEQALDYKPEDDIIISTYPKTGTTWIQYLVYEILNDGKPLPSFKEMSMFIPFMEVNGSDNIKNLPSPRVLKFHLPYHLTPYSPSAKYISIIRNPFDVVVSYYNFLKQITKVKNLKFDDLFDAFVTGKCIYGDYFDHALSWYSHRNDKNVLVLSYEAMVRDPRSQLLSLASFLGHDLGSNEELINRILKHTSFEYMKSNVKTMSKTSSEEDKQATKIKEKDTVDFFKVGSPGSGKLIMTEQQLDILKNRIEEKTKGKDIHLLWR